MSAVVVSALLPLKASVVVDFTTAGWYSNQGVAPTNTPGSDNYFAAGEFHGNQFEDFFNFNLLNFTGTVTSATITITNRQDTIPAVSPNASDTYQLSDSTANPANLANGTATFGIVGVNPYGSFSADFNTITDGEQFTITLDAAAITALNAAIGTGTFTTAGAVTTAAGSNDYLFVGEGGGATLPLAGDVFLSLTGTVQPTAGPAPEPASLVLTGSALIGLGWFALRRKTAPGPSRLG